MAIDPVNFVVGRHETGYTGLHTGPDRGQVDLPQLPGADPSGAGVDAAGGLSLGAQVLGHHVHAPALDPPHGRLGHAGGQYRVLPKALLTAAPAGIPEDVQHRHQGQVHPHLPQLLPSHSGCRLQQGGGEGGPRRQIHRQQIAIQRLVSVGALGAHQDRNAQAGMLQHIALDLIPGLGSQDAIQAGGKILPRPGVRPVQAIQRPQAAIPLHLLLEFLLQHNLLAPALVSMKAVKPLGQLAHLLPEGHTGKQIQRPLPGGKPLVLIW